MKTTLRPFGAASAACSLHPPSAVPSSPRWPPRRPRRPPPRPIPARRARWPRTIGSVATSTGNYLDAHPQTNTALTTISQQQAGPQSLVALKTYFDANPQAAKDMQALQQPLTDLSAAAGCRSPLPQLMGLLQGAHRRRGALPGAEFARIAARRTDRRVCRAAIRACASPSPASAVVAPGTGPLPGPATGDRGSPRRPRPPRAEHAVSWGFRAFCVLVRRKARKSATDSA